MMVNLKLHTIQESYLHLLMTSFTDVKMKKKYGIQKTKTSQQSNDSQLQGGIH